MKRNLLLLIAVFVCTYSFGQGEIDAHRYSSNELSGSARGQAMGGAFGALGGDITGIAVNPAGVGVYRSSELVANMSVASNNAKTDWGGATNSQSKTKFSFDNLAYVGYFPLGNSSLSSINFGFNYNRLKNFDRRYSTSGSGMQASLTDYIAAVTSDFNDEEGIYYDDMNATSSYDPYSSRAGLPWLSVLGWTGHLMDQRNGSKYQYQGLFQGNPGERPSINMNVTEKGYIETYDFTLGTGIADRLYLGLTFSITDMFYSMRSTYGENFSGGGYTLDNYLETDGSGYQLKVGAIYRPADFLRLGVAYYSPTWYSMTDYFWAETYANYTQPNGENASNVRAKTPDDAFSNYHLRTPYSWTFSAAAIIGTQAILSLDYEIKDYKSMKLEDSNGYEFKSDNGYIDNDFKVASTVRIGAEYKFTPQFSGRLGYAWMQNPYEADFGDGKREVMTAGTVTHYTLDGDVNYFTAGIGYRFTPRFYMDAAFVYRAQKNDLYFYSPIEALDVASYPASYDLKTYKGMLTLGYKF